MACPVRAPALAVWIGCILTCCGVSSTPARAGSTTPLQIQGTCTSTTVIPGTIGASASAFLAGPPHASAVDVPQCMTISTTYPVRLRLSFSETVDSKNMGVRVFVAPIAAPPHSGGSAVILPPVNDCVPIGPRTGQWEVDIPCNSNYRVSVQFYWSLPGGCIPGANNGTLVAEVARSPITGSSPSLVQDAGGSDGAMLPEEGPEQANGSSSAPPAGNLGRSAAPNLARRIPDDPPPGGGHPPDYTDLFDRIFPYVYYETVNGIEYVRINEAAAAAAYVPQSAIDLGRDIAIINNAAREAAHFGFPLDLSSLPLGNLNALPGSSGNRAVRYPCGSKDNPQPTPPYHCSDFYSEDIQDVRNELLAQGYHVTPVQAGGGYTKPMALPGCPGYPMAGRLNGLIKKQGACWTYWWQGPEPNPEVWTYLTGFPPDSRGSALYWVPYNLWWHVTYTDFIDIQPIPQCPSGTAPQQLVVDDAGPGPEVGRRPDHTTLSASPRFEVTAWPNPTASRVLLSGGGSGLSGKVRIVICDAAGRRVYRKEVAISGGRFHVEWDGGSPDGTRVRPGLYFARIESGADRAQRTIILTR